MNLLLAIGFSLLVLLNGFCLGWWTKPRPRVTRIDIYLDGKKIREITLDESHLGWKQ